MMKIFLYLKQRFLNFFYVLPLFEIVTEFTFNFKNVFSFKENTRYLNFQLIEYQNHKIKIVYLIKNKFQLSKNLLKTKKIYLLKKQ